MKAGCLVVFFVVLAGIGVLLAIGGSVNRDVVDALRPKQETCRQSFAQLRRTGFFTSDTVRSGSITVGVNEAAWRALTYDDKVRQGLLVFCAHMPADGRFHVQLRGSHSGDSLGTVQDGHWFRP